MTDSIIERAARTLATDLYRQYQDGNPGPYADTEDLSSARLDGDFDLRGIVTTVLRAIREPSEAILEAGYQADGEGGGHFDGPAVWKAMIDAALKT